jgi:hypothetical protein
MTQATAFWTIAPGIGELRAETLPPTPPGHRRVHTLASGISRGTESLVFAGRVPASQHATMRAPLMAGDFPFPVKYGYAAVGMSEAERVFVLHPHQDVFDAPAPMCIPVPATVPTPRATLAANMETALNISWDAACLPGERVLVLGAGVLGLLTAHLLAKIPAIRLTILDPDPARRATARALGLHAPETPPDNQDLVIHTSATEAGLRTALAACAFEARIIEASWFGDRAPALPLGEAFHAKRLRLLSSQVGAVAPALRPRRTHAERLAIALDLLAEPVLDTLLEPPTRFATLPQAMPRLLAHGLCHVITYGSP